MDYLKQQKQQRLKHQHELIMLFARRVNYYSFITYIPVGGIKKLIKRCSKSCAYR